MISGCCLTEFIRHAHLILECNSSLILICFLIICNIISQKPPFFNSFSQKKVQLLRVGIRFLCSSDFYSLKIKLYQDFQKVRRKLSVVQMAGIEPARFIQPQDFKLFHHFVSYLHLTTFILIIFVLKSLIFLIIS